MNIAEDVGSRRRVGERAAAMKILAVDDDGLILMNTVAMLEDMGHSVIEARSGEAALTLARDIGDIDLLITDQAMAELSGLELARLLTEERPDLPVVLATGYGHHFDDLPEAITILPKPFDAQSLESAMSEALRLR